MMRFVASLMSVFFLLTCCSPGIAKAPVKAVPFTEHRVPASGAQMIELETFEEGEVRAVMKQISKWEKAKVPEIWIRINSNGGSVENGYALIQRIESSRTRIVCVADYKAYSMGFYLLQGCHERLMTKRAGLMAHEVSTSGVGGNQHELQEYIHHLKMLSDGLMRHAMAKMNISEKEFRAKITGKGWWFSYEEAKKYGAIDGLADPTDLPPLTAVDTSPGLLQLLGL